MMYFEEYWDTAILQSINSIISHSVYKYEDNTVIRNSKIVIIFLLIDEIQAQNNEKHLSFSETWL